MLCKVKGGLVMVGELTPSTNEFIINKMGYINILKIFEWNWTFMSSRLLYKDVEQLPTNINVHGHLFHHLPSMWASNVMPHNPLYGM